MQRTIIEGIVFLLVMFFISFLARTYLPYVQTQEIINGQKLAMIQRQYILHSGNEDDWLLTDMIVDGKSKGVLVEHWGDYGGQQVEVFSTLKEAVTMIKQRENQEKKETTKTYAANSFSVST